MPAEYSRKFKTKFGLACLNSADVITAVVGLGFVGLYRCWIANEVTQECRLTCWY